MDLSTIDLLIFDIDGTLTITKSGNTFRDSADDWQWIPDRLEILRKLWHEDHKALAFASNQGGVAYGYFGEAEMLAEGIKMVSDITDSLEAPFYLGMCFSHPGGTIAEYCKDDPRRKPKPGMLLEAAVHSLVPATRCLSVGDRPEDRKAAYEAHMLYMEANEFFARMEPDPRCARCGKHANAYCHYCKSWWCFPCDAAVHLPATGRDLATFLRDGNEDHPF